MATDPATSSNASTNRRQTGRRRRSHRSLTQPAVTLLDHLLISGIALGLLALPLAQGGRAYYAPAAIALSVSALLAIWLVRVGIAGELRLLRIQVLAISGVVLLIGLLQLLPGTAWLRWIAPTNVERWQAAKAAGATDLVPRLSLAPERTLTALLLFAMLLVFLFLVLQAFASRRRIVLLAGAITIAGALAAAIGIWPLLTGGAGWYADLGMGTTYAYGTFLSRNRFAALLGMSLLVGIGLAAGIYISRKQPRADDEHIHHLVSRRADLLLLIMSVLLLLIAATEILSLSRAATACTGLALAALAILLLRQLGRARRFYIGLTLAGALLFAATTPALEKLAGRYESLVKAGKIGMVGRLAVWQDALQMVPDYWPTGVGLGAFEYASPRYESGWLPNKISFHAHSDWLEIILELGLFLGLPLIIGILWLLIKTWRRVLPQPDPLLLWPGIGACLGLTALALHGLVESNFHSPALAFHTAAILALAVLAGRIPGVRSRRRTRAAFHVVSLPPAARALTVVIAPLLLTGVTLWAVPRIKAGFRMEQLRRLSQSPESPLPDAARYRRSEHAVALADDVLQVLPTHSRTRRQRAAHRLQMIDIKLKTVRLADATSAAYRKLLKDLDRVVVDLQIACQSVPTKGHYQALYAQAREQRGLLRGKLDEAAVADLYGLARENYPQVAVVTRLCADAAWRRYLRAAPGTRAAAAARRETLTLYQHVIEQNPGAAKNVYRRLWGPTEDPDLLLAVTPDLLRAHLLLYEFLYELGRYPDCLQQLDRLAGLNDDRPNPESPRDLPLHRLTRMIRIPKDAVAADLRRRRILVLGLLRRWDQRRQQIERYRSEQRRALAPELDNARALTDEGRYRQALAITRKILNQDPWYPDAILTAAAAESRLGRSNRADQLLFRFVFAPNPTATAAELTKALEHTRDFSTRPPRTSDQPPFPEHRFLQAALQFRIGRATDDPAAIAQALTALQVLDRLLQERKVLPWAQEPMLHFHIGQAQQSLQQPDAALRAYARALDACPHHLFTAQAVRAIGRDRIAAAELPDEQRQTLLSALDWLTGLNLDSPLRSWFGAQLQLYAVNFAPKELPYFASLSVRTAWLCTAVFRQNYTVHSRFRHRNQAVFGDSFKPGEPMISWRVGELIIVNRQLQPARQAVVLRNRLAPGPHTAGFSLLIAGRHPSHLTPTPPAQATAFTVVIRPDREPEPKQPTPPEGGRMK